MTCKRMKKTIDIYFIIFKIQLFYLSHTHVRKRNLSLSLFFAILDLNFWTPGT